MKTVGDALSVKVEKSSSGEHTLTWRKVIGVEIGLLIREGASNDRRKLMYVHAVYVSIYIKNRQTTFLFTE